MVMQSMMRSAFCAFMLLASLHVYAAIQLVPVIPSGLSQPVFAGGAGDSSGRLFIVEQTGRIRVLQSGASATTVFLDVQSKVVSSGERGLLGLAFHPQYAANGRFFVFYTRVSDAALVIAEFRVSANRDVADATERMLLTIPHPTYANHNGGMLAFGGDGYLYIGVGDGGSGNDPGNNAQDIESLLGKILRIDVDVPDTAAGTLYSSPAGNPFVGVPGRDEIYVVGMRNPWRFSFDRATGQQWVGDVGQGQREEVDSPIVAGGNYGWRVYEGTNCTGVDPGLCIPANYRPPLFEYTHTGGRCSLTGGYVYRGSRGALPAGTYVFGDFCTGEIFAWNGSSQTLLLDTALNVSSFGEDDQGELYVVGLGGSVSRIALVPGATTTTLASSANPSTMGQAVTLTATVTGSSPTGTLAFTDGGATLAGCGAVALAGTGGTRTATCATSSLAVGMHAIVATYSGDTVNAPSTSTTLSQQVNGTAPSTQLVNGSFEVPALSTSFRYMPTGTGIGWTFNSSAGIQGNGSAWRATSAPDGTQTAFIQNLGMIAQSVNLTAGSYVLSFRAARRSYSNPLVNPLRISINGQAVGTMIAPPSTAFAAYSIPITVANNGTQTLEFAGTVGSVDASTFVDAVTIAVAPAIVPLVNPGFEIPALGNGVQYQPAGANVGWTFGPGAGIQGNGSAWRATVAPEGTQTAFLQNLGAVAQVLNLATGSYTLTFRAARRPFAMPSGAVNPIQVSVDGQSEGAPVTPTSTTFGTYSITFTIASTGAHTIRLAGTASGGDSTTLVDAVVVSQ